jgi:uncharacterized protein HemX
MNPKAIVEAVLDNADKVSTVVLLILIAIVLGYVAYGFATGKIQSPGDRKRIEKRLVDLEATCEKTEETLDKTRIELSDAKILYAGASARMEFQEAEIRRLREEIATERSHRTRIEAELDVLRREQWRISPRSEGSTR